MRSSSSERAFITTPSLSFTKYCWTRKWTRHPQVDCSISGDICSVRQLRYGAFLWRGTTAERFFCRIPSVMCLLTPCSSSHDLLLRSWPRSWSLETVDECLPLDRQTDEQTCPHWLSVRPWLVGWRLWRPLVSSSEWQLSPHSDEDTELLLVPVDQFQMCYYCSHLLSMTVCLYEQDIPHTHSHTHMAHCKTLDGH